MVIEKNKKKVKRPRLSCKTPITASAVLIRKVKPVYQKERSLYKKKFPKDAIWNEIAGMFGYYGKVSVW